MLKFTGFAIATVKDDTRIHYLVEVIVTEKNQFYTKGDRKFPFEYYTCTPIISSTDKSITPNSWIPESFVNAYAKSFNEGKPITEVNLEIISWSDCPDSLKVNCMSESIWGKNNVGKPKVRPDNSVIIHQSKMYSRDEVIKILRDAHLDIVDGNYAKGLNKWIEENL